MKRFAWILIPVFIAVGCIAFLYINGEGPEFTKIESTKSGLSAERKERRFQKSLREISRFQYSGSAVQEWTIFNDKLYILDAQTQKINVFTPDGTPKEVLGKPGDAPWENRQTMHLWADNEGYATVDNAHMAVKKYSLKDDLLYYDKLKEPIWDGVYMGRQRFFLIDDVPDNPAFFTHNAASGTQGDRIPLVSLLDDIPEGKYLNVMYEGQLLRGGDKILYMCARTGKFFVFDIYGEYQYTGHTLDNTSPPRVTARKSGNITYFVREPDLNINYSGTSDGTYLYILSLISWEPTSNLSIDAYLLSDGTYSHSLSVPNAGKDLPIEILAGENELFVLYEGLQIIRYAMD